jgi:putative oxidoreductase
VERFLGRYSSYIYALLRIVAGLLLLMHGTQKLFGWPVAMQGPSNTMMTAVGVLETVAGIMIMIGLFTSWPAFIISGELAVAYFMMHQPRGTWPIQNGGELAAIYSFLFLYIASRGSGPWSVDSLIRNPRPLNAEQR